MAKLSCVRLLLVMALGLAAAAAIVRTAVVSSFAERKPQLALRVWPDHPRVALAGAMGDVGIAAATGQRVSSETMTQVMAAARRGPLMIEPFLIKGAEELSHDRSETAVRLFLEARRRDPRSAAARFFLAQHYLSVGRPVEGLAEASVLTRLVSGASSALVPGLVQYAREAGSIPQLRKIFAADPQLGDQVLAELARDASNAALIDEIAGDKLGPSDRGVPSWQSQLLRSLVERGQFTQAHTLWRRISGERDKPTGIFNSQFSNIAAPPPFNWTFGKGEFGIAEPANSGGLRVIYYGRNDGQFASQILLLAPGTYKLQMLITGEGGGEALSGLTWTLSCQPGATRLLALPFAKTSGRARALAGRFTVPSNCPAQELVLNGVAREFASSEQVLVSNLQLVRGE